jgi:hypothetical protein
VRDAVAWLRGHSISAVWRVLDRFDLGLKRGQARLYSPDPQYPEKLAFVLGLILKAMASHGRIVVVFCDELTYYRQASMADVYARKGRVQPHVTMSQKRNASWRIIGGLEVTLGRVTFRQGSVISVATLVKFFKQLVAAYPAAETIYVVVDNWPVHFHPDVMAALEEQENPFAVYLPASWRTIVSTKKRQHLPIQLIPLPTYAPSTNPIEKLWRWLKQRVLHMHTQADSFDELKQQITEFLEAFEQGSEALLRYVGLTSNSKAYGAAYQEAS